MNPFSADMESVVESELIDLSTVSMAALRTLDGAAIRRALRHVTKQPGYPGVTEQSEGERID